MPNASVSKIRDIAAAAATPNALEEAIEIALKAVPVTNHPFINRGLAAATLDTVHRTLEVLDVLDVRDGYEMPDGGEYVLRGLREHLIAAAKYATSLVEIEDEMRSAARMQAEVAHV